MEILWVLLLGWPVTIPLLIWGMKRLYDAMPHRRRMRAERWAESRAFHEKREAEEEERERLAAEKRIKACMTQVRRNQTILDRLDKSKKELTTKDFSGVSFSTMESAQLYLDDRELYAKMFMQTRWMAKMKLRCPDGPMPGRVYVLTSQAMPDMVKIGYTQGSVEKRARELSSTGVPVPFVVRFIRKTGDCRTLEGRVHSYLKRYRVSKKKEFFKVSVKDAVLAISECS